MARWEPRTPKESLEVSLRRIDTRIKGKEDEIKELKDQRKQVETAIKAPGSRSPLQPVSATEPGFSYGRPPESHHMSDRRRVRCLSRHQFQNSGALWISRAMRSEIAAADTPSRPARSRRDTPSNHSASMVESSTAVQHPPIRYLAKQADCRRRSSATDERSFGTD